MCNINMQFEISKLMLKKERDFERKTLQLDGEISLLKKTAQWYRPVLKPTVISPRSIQPQVTQLNDLKCNFKAENLPWTEIPPLLFALQVYRLASSFVILLKERDVLCPLEELFLSQIICGLGRPWMILQVKVTVSPSLIRLLAPETLTSGRTLKKQVKQLKHIG